MLFEPASAIARALASGVARCAPVHAKGALIGASAVERRGTAISARGDSCALSGAGGTAIPASGRHWAPTDGRRRAGGDSKSLGNPMESRQSGPAAAARKPNLVESNEGRARGIERHGTGPCSFGRRRLC